MSESDSPEDDFSPEEMAQAAALAEQVDDLVAGRAAPVVLASGDRDLLQSSSMIYAAHHEMTLSDARKSALIEEALAGATGARRADFEEEVPSDLDRARAKRRLGLGVAVLGFIAAAAVLLLVWRTPPGPRTADQGHGQGSVVIQIELPESEQSRPSDALIGQISRDESGQAGERLELLYADRMAGYRSLQYRRMAAKP